MITNHSPPLDRELDHYKRVAAWHWPLYFGGFSSLACLDLLLPNPWQNLRQNTLQNIPSLTIVKESHHLADLWRHFLLAWQARGRWKCQLQHRIWVLIALVLNLGYYQSLVLYNLILYEWCNQKSWLSGYPIPITQEGMFLWKTFHWSNYSGCFHISFSNYLRFWPYHFSDWQSLSLFIQNPVCFVIKTKNMLDEISVWSLGHGCASLG